MLRDQLVKHFSSTESILSNDLLKYVWSDSERSGILVESVFKWKGDLVQKRPAILIRPNAYQNSRFLLGERVGLTGEGNEEFTTIWIGSHTLFCIHGTGASVDILAGEVRKIVHRYSPATREYLNLLKYQVVQVGAPSEVEEATENYVVPIVVAWAFQESWELRYEALPLRRVPLSVLVDGAELS